MGEAELKHRSTALMLKTKQTNKTSAIVSRLNTPDSFFIKIHAAFGAPKVNGVYSEPIPILQSAQSVKQFYLILLTNQPVKKITDENTTSMR